MTTYFPEGPLASVLRLLPGVQCPTLIIRFRDDAVHPLAEAQKLAAGIPKSELGVPDTANHVPLYGNAVRDRFMATFPAFLAD